MKIFIFFVLLVSLFASDSAAAAEDKDGEAATASRLLEINLPAGAVRLAESKSRRSLIICSI